MSIYHPRQLVSELLPLNKFVRITGAPFVTVISSDDNELIMKTYPLVTNTIILKVDRKVNNNNGVTMKSQR